MPNFAALRAAIFSLSTKNLRWADIRPPSVRGLMKYNINEYLYSYLFFSHSLSHFSHISMCSFFTECLCHATLLSKMRISWWVQSHSYWRTETYFRLGFYMVTLWFYKRLDCEISYIIIHAWMHTQHNAYIIHACINTWLESVCARWSDAGFALLTLRSASPGWWSYFFINLLVCSIRAMYC